MIKKIFNNKKILFGFIFLIQLCFSTYQISFNSLWYDECFTINTAIKTIPEIIEVSKSDVNPPLYPIIVHYWIKLFGISEFPVRFLSALAGSLACAFMFLFSLKFLNKQAAFFGVLMFMSSNEFFYYSQEARTYSLILLTVVLSNYCYFSLFKENSNKRLLLFAIGLGVLNATLFYLHFLSCFNIIAQVICFPLFVSHKHQVSKANLNESKKVSEFFKYYLLSTFISISFLLPFANRFISLVTGSLNGSKMWLQKATSLDLKNCVYELCNDKRGYQIYLYTLIGFVLLLLIKQLRSQRTNFNYIIFFIVAGPLMFLLSYFIAHYSPIFLARYVLFTYLSFILLYSYLLSSLKLNIALKVLFMVVIAYFSFTKIKIPRYLNQDYKNCVAFLISKKTNTTLISTDLQDIFSYYYDKNIFKINNDTLKSKKLFENGIFYQYNDLDWPNRIDLSKYKDIYYTESFAFLNDGNNVVRINLNNKLNFKKRIINFHGINITHYENPNFNKN